MTNREATPAPQPRRCRCGHDLAEHLSKDHRGANAAGGECWVKTGEHVEREPVLTCRIPAHAHDARCRSFCPFTTGEHVHTKECWEVWEQNVPERCGCTGFDDRTDEEVARDAYQQSRACFYCGHPESAHAKENNRPCRAPLHGYPTGWTCGAKDCQGYLPVSEFRLHPHKFLGASPGGWSPQLEAQAKRLRDARDARDAEVERRLAMKAKEKEDAQ